MHRNASSNQNSNNINAKVRGSNSHNAGLAIQTSEGESRGGSDIGNSNKNNGEDSMKNTISILIHFPRPFQLLMNGEGQGYGAWRYKDLGEKEKREYFSQSETFLRLVRYKEKNIV